MFWNKPSKFFSGHGLKLVLFTLVVAVLLRTLFLGAYVVQTATMVPTVRPGEFLLAWKTFVPHRGDIVLLPCPKHESNICIKRVVGIPGDRVEISGQRLLINTIAASYDKMPSDGTLPVMSEKWQTLSWLISSDSEPLPDMDAVVVSTDHVFLLNDNRSDTSDSRQWGPVPSSRLEAKAWRIWMSVDWSKNRVNWGRLFHRID